MTTVEISVRIKRLRQCSHYSFISLLEKGNI